MAMLAEEANRRKLSSTLVQYRWVLFAMFEGFLIIFLKCVLYLKSLSLPLLSQCSPVPSPCVMWHNCHASESCRQGNACFSLSNFSLKTSNCIEHLQMREPVQDKSLTWTEINT